MAFLGGSSVAFAQGTPPAAGADDDIVELEAFEVTGIRASLAQGLDIKKQNIQLVDSIVAEDIGKFPDNNVIEALQRMTGVQVTDRSRGEISAVTIRGLSDVTTTVNGRNVFTASSLSVALQDIPAALLSRIDVFKTRSSKLIESGIAGVIDIRTQRPFDFKGHKVVLAARGIREDQADTINPNISALASNVWDLSNGGKFGALISLSYARTKWREQAVTAGAMVPFMTDQPLEGWVPYQRIFPDPDPTTGQPFWQAGLDDGLPDDAGSTLTMFGVQVPYVLSRDAVFASDWTGDRKRPAANLSLQYAPDDRSTYTFDVFYNGYREKTFNDLQFVFVDWWGALSANPAADVDLYPGTNIVKARRNVGFPYGFMSGDFATGKTDSILYGLNGKWEINDRLNLEADLAYQDSQYDTTFFAVRTDRVHRSVSVDFNEHDWLTSFSYGDDPATADVDESDLTNPALWNVAQMWDNGNYSKGDAATLTLDGDYKADWGPFKTISFGLRYDDRGASAGQRTQNANGLGRSLSTFDSAAIYVNENFFDGRVDVPSTWAVFNGYYIPGHEDEIRTLYNNTIGAGLDLAADLTMQETFDVSQKTTSTYVMSDFELKAGDSRIDGQIGFRYVRVKTDSVFTDLTTLERTPGSSSRNKLLPSFTVRYDITPKLRTRFSFCETLRPPNFNDLNPTINYVEDVTDIGYGTASGGNADLKATESKNYDLSLEYYWGKANAIYGSLFRRDIDGLVIGFRRRVTAQTEAHPEGYDYILSQPFNASNGKLDGYEIGLVYFPEQLPSVLDGIGVQASYTSLDSSQNIPLTNSAGEVVGQDVGPFFGVSDTSYNVILAYDKKKFSVRLGYVWRKNFLARNEAALFANPIGIYRRPDKSLDLQVSWQAMENLSITFDATNLTDELQQEYYKYPATNNFGSVILDRSFSIGARYSF